MKDFRVKKKNIDLAYYKAIDKLRISLCKELYQQYENSWSRDYSLYKESDNLMYKGRPITEFAFEDIWKLYDKIFKKAVFGM